MATLSAPFADFASVIVNTPANVAMTVIVSSLPRLVITQDSNAPDDGSAFFAARDHDLTVYANEVVIRGPLVMPSRNVKIFARHIGSEWGAGGAAAINVDGAAGAPATPINLAAANPGGGGSSGGHDPGGTGGAGSDGQNGNNGNAGQKGGTIDITCERLASDINLAMSMKGGDGSAGTDGQPGGSGGRGGDGQSWSHWFPNGRFGHMSRWGSRGGDGGAGGRGGNAGAGAIGGAGGRFSLYSLWALPSVPAFDSGGATGAMGRPGKGGAGGGGGSGGHNQPDGATGRAGADGSAAASPGNAAYGGGHAATPGPDALDTLPARALEMLPATVSCGEQWTGWCAMMLRAAKAFYLSADPVENTAGFARAADLLVWLHKLLRQFDPPPASFPRLGPDDLAQLQAIRHEVVSLLARLGHRHDVFGHEYNFVPRASLDSYLADLKVITDTYREVEGQYTTYLAALGQQQTAQQQLSSALTSSRSLLSSLGNQMFDILGQINAMPATLDKARDAVTVQQKVLKDSIGSLESAIERKANCPLQNIFQALQMCAFLPENVETGQAAAIAASIVGPTVISGIENVPLGAGGSMSRSYLISQVDVYGTGVTSIQQGYASSGPFITSTDPNGYKLMTSAQQLRAELMPYTSLAETQQVLTDLQTYVDLVGVMNAAILQYNTLVSHYVQMQSQTAQLNGQSTTLQNQLQAAIDPTLPQYTRYLSGLHDSLRDSCIYQIYMVGRAYEFWAIEPYGGLYSLLGRGDPGGIAAVTVAGVFATVSGALTDAKNAFGRDAQHFPPDPPPGTLSRSGGVLFEVTDPAALKMLRDSGEMYFSVPPALADSTKLQNPFVGKSNVRLYIARPWVTGATIDDETKPKTLTITLTHTGSETLVAPSGVAMGFKHDPIVVSFTYDYSLARSDPNAIGMDANIGSPTGSDYAPVGPFTLWRLAIEKHLNDPSLNLKNIRSVEIEFWGGALPFAADGAGTAAADKNKSAVAGHST